jgi:hypothetical protein
VIIIMGRNAQTQTAPGKASSANRNASSTHTDRNGIAARQRSHGNRSLAEQVQRSKDEKRQQHVRELALDPASAHRELNELSGMERFELAIRIAAEMQRRFDARFADEFLAAVRDRKGHGTIAYWPPGTGPTPQRLRELGNVLVGKEEAGLLDVEIWVHPTGTRTRRDVSTWRFGAADVPGDNRKGDLDVTTVTPVPDKVDPYADDFGIGDLTELDPDEMVAFEMAALYRRNAMEAANSKLAELCTRDADHFDKSAAEAAQRQFRSSRRRLRADFAGVYWSAPFWQAVNEAAMRNEQLRWLCCQTARDFAVDLDQDLFDCKSVPIRDDDE